VERCSSAGRISSRPAITATVSTALPRKTQPVSVAAMITPASAGPAIRALLKVAELRLTALATSAVPTISTTKDCRAGTSSALATPSRAASR
jgi:hypothetical protein